MRWWVGIGLLVLLVSCVKEFPDSNAVILGHAGESLYKSRSKYPPNTLKSIQRAIDLGADGVEIDVQMSSDGILLAYHDLLLEENTQQSGCINSMTSSQATAIKVYKTDYTIEPLSPIVDYLVSAGKKVFLDVKHYNACTEQNINFIVFNAALNDLLSNYSPQQKENIVINSRSIDFISSITDTIVQLSFESDDPEEAIPLINSHNLNLFTTRLATMNSVVRQKLRDNGIGLAIFNVKTKGEVNKALELDPEFVISDNIECTLKATDG